MDRRRRANFKVPEGIKSRNNHYRSPVHFKNLSDDLIEVYWIDYMGKPQLFAELMPISRNDPGLPLVTFVTHPFVAIYKRRIQSLLNGNRYFLPPRVESWNTEPQGWVNPKWNLSNRADENKGELSETITYDMNGAAEKYYEVIILPPICMSLRQLCLLKSCELYPDEKATHSLDIPSHLKDEIEFTRKKYFFIQT